MPTPRTVKMPKSTGNLDASRIKRAVRSAYRYNTCHVLYDSRSKAEPWVVRNVRQTIGRKTFRTKSAAVGYAEMVSKRHGCDIVVHGKTGDILRSRRHGIK